MELGTTCRDHALADLYPQPLPRWLLPLLTGPKFRENLVGCDTAGEKSLLQNVATAVAINFSRGSAWLEGEPLVVTRKSRFAVLAALNSRPRSSRS